MNRCRFPDEKKTYDGSSTAGTPGIFQPSGPETPQTFARSENDISTSIPKYHFQTASFGNILFFSSRQVLQGQKKNMGFTTDILLMDKILHHQG